jgi:predicted AlkP superfamily pyrophosphatase or phosphodiesterase
VDGLPQSATGQAMLVTGKNISAELGYHYGPKPNPAVAEYLKTDTIFSKCVATGKKTALLNAYPPRYFDGIDSGKRLYSSIPLAVTNAGLPLFKEDAYFAGTALSADFTGDGWRTMLGFPDAPVMDAPQAGRKIATLAKEYDFSLFEYWASDYAGHKQQMETAIGLMEIFDGVVGGLVDEMEEERRKTKDELLVVVTSDHGNMEDLSTRKHTDANVPALVIGNKTAREEFTREMTDLTHIAPAIWRMVAG